MAQRLNTEKRSSPTAMKLDGHYDEKTDVAWLRVEDYDPARVVAEEVEFGLRELDPSDRQLVGLEYWRASEWLPADLLRIRHRPRWSSTGPIDVGPFPGTNL